MSPTPLNTSQHYVTHVLCYCASLIIIHIIVKFAHSYSFSITFHFSLRFVAISYMVLELCIDLNLSSRIPSLLTFSFLNSYPLIIKVSFRLGVFLFSSVKFPLCYFGEDNLCACNDFVSIQNCSLWSRKLIPTILGIVFYLGDLEFLWLLDSLCFFRFAKLHKINGSLWMTEIKR